MNVSRAYIVLYFFLAFFRIYPTVASQSNTSPKVENTHSGESYNKTLRPNVLLILVDDLGYGDLEGVFGHPTSLTPNINALAERSKVFTNFYVASPVCSPSR